MLMLLGRDCCGLDLFSQVVRSTLKDAVRTRNFCQNIEIFQNDIDPACSTTTTTATSTTSTTTTTRSNAQTNPKLAQNSKQ